MRNGTRHIQKENELFILDGASAKLSQHLKILVSYFQSNTLSVQLLLLLPFRIFWKEKATLLQTCKEYTFRTC